MLLAKFFICFGVITFCWLSFSKGSVGNSTFINSKTFISIADLSFNDMQSCMVTQLINNKAGSIIFVDPSLLQYFFLLTHPLIQNQYVLVTHDDDCSVPIDFEYILNDPKIIAWFGQNPTFFHKKFIALPAGIGSFKKVSALRKTLKKDDLKKKILLYLNIDIFTHFAQRNEVQQFFETKPFCTMSMRKPYKLYLKDLAQSKFVISPHGFSLDCPRTWEALYMQAIPIVKSSMLDPLYKDLPVLIVDSWNQITSEFLKIKWQEFENREFKVEKLTSKYWHAKIKKMAKL